MPPDKHNYECQLCDKQFRYNSNLYRHTKEVHKTKFISETKYVNRPKGNFSCPICHLCIIFHDEFVKHCLSAHEITIQSQTLYFTNDEEFENWKTEIQETSRTYFVLRDSDKKKVKNEVRKVSRFGCSRSGFYKPKPDENNRKRKIKTQGSKKINGFCPCGIKVTYFNDGKVTVDYCPTHVGHELDLVHLALKPEEGQTLLEFTTLTKPCEKKEPCEKTKPCKKKKPSEKTKPCKEKEPDSVVVSNNEQELGWSHHLTETDFLFNIVSDIECEVEINNLYVEGSRQETVVVEEVGSNNNIAFTEEKDQMRETFNEVLDLMASAEAFQLGQEAMKVLKSQLLALKDLDSLSQVKSKFKTSKNIKPQKRVGALRKVNKLKDSNQPQTEINFNSLEAVLEFPFSLNLEA